MARRDETWRAGSGLGGGLGSGCDGGAGAGAGRSGDEDEGVFPPKGSTTDCSPQWGQRTTVVPTRSGFFDLIALEHRLHGNWVTNVSRNWRRAPATSPASASRRAGSGSRQARQIASRSLGTLGFRVHGEAAPRSISSPPNGVPASSPKRIDPRPTRSAPTDKAR